MDKETAEILTEYGGIIYENYSGRSMLGRTTTGIKINDYHMFFHIIADVLEDGWENEQQQVAEVLRELYIDSLGTELILY